MNNCLNCSTQTSNPKFCSRSCSATYNNSLMPKRIKQRKNCFTQNCNHKIKLGNKYCSDCWQNYLNLSLIRQPNLTKGDLLTNDTQKYRRIREMARTIMAKSGKPYQCEVCSYSFHVDVAHVIGVETYSNDTLMSVINNIENLKYLCKNHHWEFDHGGIQSEP